MFRFPDVITGNLMLDEIKIISENGFIGFMPGIYECMNYYNSYSDSFGVVVSGSGNLSGRVMEYIPVYTGKLFFDLTGPWY